MKRLLAVVLAVFVASVSASAQTALQLRWELEEDLFAEGAAIGASRVEVTLTNHDTKPLEKDGWAIYWTALHSPWPDSVEGDVRMEGVTGGFQRIVPAPGFPGLGPGDSARFHYRSRLPNISFIPTGPYVVFDEAPDRAQALDFVAVPIERSVPAVSPEALYELHEAITDIPAEDLPPIFPTPVSLERREGQIRLSAMPEVSADAGLEAEAAFAAEYLSPHFEDGGGEAGASALRLELGTVEGQDSSEAYELVVDPDSGIWIRAASAAGVFYGLQSLRSLLPAVPGSGVSLPALRVVDAPRFGYRGLMLDVARTFHPKAKVLQTLDLMARYKLNVFHFHLTEDEGWRLEIPSLPELTSVGARRGHTLDSSEFLPPMYGSGPALDHPFGSGYYTTAEYAEILKYAAARHIEVIPELEMPGHARAAVKAMEARFRRLMNAGEPEEARRYLLSDFEDASVYTSAQGYHDNLMNPALPSTYAFVERVVADLVAIHEEAGVPLRNLHVGGDEVPAGAWERSPIAHAYMKEHGLASVDEFWFLFYGRVAQILDAHGLVPSGWEEIAMRKTRLDGRDRFIPNPGFTDRGWRAYVWNNLPGSGAEDLAYRLANGGYDVVLCPVTNMYLDLAANQSPAETGLDWGGFVDVDKPFQFIPFDYYRNVRFDRQGKPVDRSVFVGKDRLTDYGKRHVVGLQANLWSETLGGEGRLEYMLVPKLFGLAERAWAPEPGWAMEADEERSAALYREAWSAFVNVLGKRELPRLDGESPAWRYRIPTPGLKVVDGQLRASLPIPGFTLRYTTDGTEPTTESPELGGPIPADSLVRVAAFDRNGRRGHTTKLR